MATQEDNAGETPRQLLEYLAEGLVDEPEDVSVEQFVRDDGTIVLELCVADGDYGRVIGRGGRTAHALRTVVKAAATSAGCRVLVDIVD
ncbi:MAG TPA: KH domain-containing protein [Solirubrobacteraceae bacterium]|nr:KH domain-containing protein [Solirubrobacteraceae bacterium]